MGKKRRKHHKFTFFCIIINELSPSCLYDLVPQSVNTISHYNLRNVNDLQSVASRINRCYNSFLPSVFREWNDLTKDVRESDLVHSFKYILNRERTLVPKHSYNGTRIQINLHNFNLHNFNTRLINRQVSDGIEYCYRTKPLMSGCSQCTRPSHCHH